MMMNDQEDRKTAREALELIKKDYNYIISDALIDEVLSKSEQIGGDFKLRTLIEVAKAVVEVYRKEPYYTKDDLTRARRIIETVLGDQKSNAGDLNGLAERILFIVFNGGNELTDDNIYKVASDFEKRGLLFYQTE